MTLARSPSRVTLAMALLLSALLATTSLHAQPSPAPVTKRTYALIVAHNGSADEGVAPLRYADDDGARYHELFAHLADETILLTQLDADSQRVFPGLASQSSPPTRAQLTRAVDALAKKLGADRTRGLQTELYLVFTGHGNVDASSGEGYLSLMDGRLRRSELYREVLRPLEADYTHLIIDACHAYFMVQSRGGDSTWSDDRSGQTHDDALAAYLKRRKEPGAASATAPTLGVILSTSGSAEVHEWSRLRAGVFSHELRSGLLGAADADGDGQITYTELEAYLAAANAGVTNPRARIQVWARPPRQDRARPLLRLSDYRRATQLTIAPGQGARYHIEDARGLRYADLHPSQDSVTRMVLLHGPVGLRDYTLRTHDTQASVPLQHASISTAQLAFARRDDQARSSLEESFRARLFSTPYGPAFYAGFKAAREQHPDHDLDLDATRAASPDASTSSWTTQALISYGLSSASLELSGAQHALHASMPWAHRQGWLLGPFLTYGMSAHTSRDRDRLDGLALDQTYRLHRLAVGVEGGLSGQWLAQRVHLGLVGRLGYQGLFLDAAQLAADPLGLRGELLLRATLQPHGWRVAPTLQAGYGVDLVRRANVERGDTFLYHTPMLQLGALF